MISCGYQGLLNNRVSQIQEAVKQRGNGQGTVYKLPNGKYAAEVTLYYYIDSNGIKRRRRKTKQFDKKKDAIAALPTLIRQGDVVKPTSLAELHEVFLHSKKYDELSKSQQDKYSMRGTGCRACNMARLLL